MGQEEAQAPEGGDEGRKDECFRKETEDRVLKYFRASSPLFLKVLFELTRIFKVFLWFLYSLLSAF